MIEATFTALKARLQSAARLNGRVHDAALMNAQQALVRDMYIILMPSAPTDYTTGRYLGTADSNATATFDFDTRFVGRSATEVYALMDEATPLLEGHRLIVAGRKNDPIQVDASTSVRPDRSVSPPLFYADTSWVFISRPA